MLALRMTLGVAFGILGVAGLLLPILPGWIFLLLGFLTLFPRNRFSEKSVDKIERRFPRIGRLLRRLGVGTQTAG